MALCGSIVYVALCSSMYEAGSGEGGRQEDGWRVDWRLGSAGRTLATHGAACLVFYKGEHII